MISLKKKKQYSPEFKLQVVKDYLSSDKSLNDIANEYSIPSSNTVHKWVKKYVDSGYIISDISKVPPFIYESAGIIKSDSNNKDARGWKVTFIGHYLLILKYRSFGVSLSFLLKRYNISSSTFYYNTRLFFVVKRKRKSYFKGFSFNTNGEKVSDEYIKKLLFDILSVSNPSNPEFFYKTLGSKKLAYLFKQKYNIIINHKKIYR